MTLNKARGNKRASLPRASDYTKSFLKDWERLAHSGRYDLNRLKEVMMRLIVNDGPLGPEWVDHALMGDWVGYRECHVGGDFLLIYQFTEPSKQDLIVFVRADSHADLFE